ncbi:MAG: hypothetical protein HN932_04090 [Candidatus Marinimicrobia bacterium]|jgi:hypothetical protein|nr:hypothetical protein [Candidatus Neomarinimicrobiota bacterium]
MARKMNKAAAPPPDESGDIQTAGREPERKRARPQAAGGKAPKHDPGRVWPFRLVFSRNYEIAEVEGVGPVLLPDFEQIKDQPGCNNVKQRKKGPPDCKLRDGKLVEQQRIPIPVTEYMEYIEVTDDEDVTKTYHYRHTERVTEYPSGRVQVTFDRAKHHQWCCELYRRKLVPPPYDYEIEDIRHNLEQRLDRARSHPMDKASDKSRWTRKGKLLEHRLEILDQAAANAAALYDGPKDLEVSA